MKGLDQRRSSQRQALRQAAWAGPLLAAATLTPRADPWATGLTTQGSLNFGVEPFGATAQAAGHGHACALENLLGQGLVHGQALAMAPGARVGQASHLQHALQPAVLAARPVQGQKGDTVPLCLRSAGLKAVQADLLMAHDGLLGLPWRRQGGRRRSHPRAACPRF